VSKPHRFFWVFRYSPRKQMYLTLCRIKTKKTFTKRTYIHRSFRLPADELRRWQEAATKLGVSQTAFVRHAILERAALVLGFAYLDTVFQSSDHNTGEEALRSQGVLRDD